MSDKKKIWILANGSVDSPEYPCPKRAERPSPKMVSANPVATWLDKRIWVKNPNRPAAIAPVTGDGSQDHHTLEAEVKDTSPLDH